jgi:putative ABC transport system permease protein
MRIARLMRQSMTALGRNPMRSFLVMLGVIIGIASLTIVVGMAKAANRKVMQRVNNFGPTAIMLFAGGGKNVPGVDPSAATLTLDDVKVVESQVRGIRLACPMVMRMRVPAIYGDQSTEVTLQSGSASWQEAWDWYVSDGDFFSEQDCSSMARVVVIGQTVARTLFQGSNPVGETIRIRNVNFQVKGVLPSRGIAPAGGDMDDRVVIPLTTAMRRVFNVTTISAARLRVNDPGEVHRAAAEIRALLRERHHIHPPDLDDFRVVTPDVIAGLSEMVAGTLNKILIAVTALSLVVGGIVLMNLMLLSVTERRHEIGLRRALGGKRRDILLQFLFESIVLTSTGGLTGLVIGIGSAIAVRKATGSAIAVSWEPLVLAVALSLLVGLVFGLVPARRAAKMPPVQALR